jgi:hypothetical protein
MDDETMYLIHGEDYLTHIYEKVEMYLLLKQLISEVDEIPPCPANHDAKEMAMLPCAISATISLRIGTSRRASSLTAMKMIFAI